MRAVRTSGVGLAAGGAVLLALLLWAFAVGPWYCPRPVCSGGSACLVPSCVAYVWIFLVGGPVLLASGVLLAYLARPGKQELPPGPAVHPP